MQQLYNVYNPVQQCGVVVLGCIILTGVTVILFTPSTRNSANEVKLFHITSGCHHWSISNIFIKGLSLAHQSNPGQWSKTEHRMDTDTPLSQKNNDNQFLYSYIKEVFPCHCRQVLAHGGNCWVSVNNNIKSTV